MTAKSSTTTAEARLAIVEWLKGPGAVPLADKITKELALLASCGYTKVQLDKRKAEYLREAMKPASWKRAYKGNGMRLFEDTTLLFHLLLDDNLEIISYRETLAEDVDTWLHKHGIRYNGFSLVSFTPTN